MNMGLEYEKCKKVIWARLPYKGDNLQPPPSPILSCNIILYNLSSNLVIQNGKL